ncbi:three component ABC system middle component [Sorangium sp. So ce381]|uniref:three component ABC system middle component n=1 Tax=Sorangium sp. So ce381 TaxID=3133307 RepID=UPI003F5BFD24
MSTTLEHDLVQNAALGATALWSFARGYMDRAEGREGPELPTCIIVLPMVYHRRTATTIHRMRADSGLLKALHDNPELIAGLQRRLEALATRSLQALNVAVSSSLLEWDHATPWPRVTPKRKTLPPELQSGQDDVATILGAAKRLGWWFAAEDVVSICLRLGVRF